MCVTPCCFICFSQTNLNFKRGKVSWSEKFQLFFLRMIHKKRRSEAKLSENRLNFCVQLAMLFSDNWERSVKKTTRAIDKFSLLILLLSRKKLVKNSIDTQKKTEKWKTEMQPQKTFRLQCVPHIAVGYDVQPHILNTVFDMVRMICSSLSFLLFFFTQIHFWCVSFRSWICRSHK